MIHLVMALLVSAFLFVTASPAESADAAMPAVGNTPGMQAPDFTGTDSNGKTHTLSDYLGKTVVLEWTNDQCPYVRKHYDTNNMQSLQEQAVKDGVIWLTVNSSAEGKQGHSTPEEANKIIGNEKSHETARILDTNGVIGKLYDATTTPHMFVIDATGRLAYAGGIDDQPSVTHATVKTATNYVKAALDDLKAGKPVQVASSKPYGCGVKY